METLARILVVSDDQSFVSRLRDLVAHPQVVVDCTSAIPEDLPYHFYILGGSAHISEAVDTIRKVSEGSPIYLVGAVCEKNVPLRKMIKCNIVDCIENEREMRSFVKRIITFRKRKIKMNEVSRKLDFLKTGDLESLQRQMKKIESDRFVDYIQNHPLPMILCSCEYDVLHANDAMENLIGTRLEGAPVATYWADSEDLDRAIFDLKEKGQLLGREATLKNINGELLKMKLYTSLHCDDDGNWLNTRCLFVPCD